ncbi:hypothetical protein NQ317_018404 [Molorchus minor]|uniref:Receptor ligand binding region domain-containing protein n=1 Tax=Molorchus minor TaxID=1323400 RepID=A0ABQ9JRC9_9CUCU|nr:hypothetical protein NQ317_018404 [Molorchus minor]
MSGIWFRTTLVIGILTRLFNIAENTDQDKQISSFINGDFIIGALFPIHYPPPSKKRSTASLGIKCGSIRRACWYAPVALQQSIELIRDAITPSNIDSCPGHEDFESANAPNEARGPLIGVVGPGSSSVALQVQNLLQLFHLPQVGYSTTSRDLSDKSRFNYFLRVVPSDYYQAQVILDIVRNFGWTYVSAVNTDGTFLATRNM